MVDDLPAENVKFIFYKIEEYIQNTPAELVTEVMERHKGWSIELTYEEAIPLVSISAIQEYVAEELSVKNMAFMLSECPQSAENLRAILARPFADFPADDIRRAYRDTQNRYYIPVLALHGNPLVISFLGDRVETDIYIKLITFEE